MDNSVPGHFRVPKNKVYLAKPAVLFAHRSALRQWVNIA
jgi:hypothetical protein